MDGEPISLELDMIYEGCKPGNENTQDMQDVGNVDAVLMPRKLVRKEAQPASFVTLLTTPKKRQTSTNDIIAVPLMPKTKVIKPRIRQIDANIQELSDQATVNQICVLEDACMKPEKSVAVNDLSKYAPCSESL